jgi:hypothetical protein
MINEFVSGDNLAAKLFDNPDEDFEESIIVRSQASCWNFQVAGSIRLDPCLWIIMETTTRGL